MVQFILMLVSVVLAAGLFRASQPHRGAIEEALSGGGKRPPEMPERIPTYDAAFLDDFRAKAASTTTKDGRRALDVYRNTVLLRLDPAFAIFLSLAVVLFWSLLPSLVPRLPYIEAASMFFAAMGLAYGVADVAEDLWLARILGRTARTERVEGTVACSLTRLKFATIVLSLLGGLLFLTFSKIFGRGKG